MKRRMKKGIGGMLLALIMITSIAAVTIPMAAGGLTHCLSGYKLDENGNELEGWTIQVTNEFGTVKQNATDENGYWFICGLSTADTWTVTEVLQPGWKQLEPVTGSWIVGPGGGDVTDLNFKNEYTAPGTGTPGYWKNHPDAWPVDEITIGGETYTKGEAIKWMKQPDKKDKTITMFRALVCAKLNGLIGNDDSCVADTIDEADTWMATNGPVGSGVKAGGKDSPWRDGEPLYLMLDDYNNGLLCAPSRG